MKVNQDRVDDGEQKCEAAETGLQEKIRAFVGNVTEHERGIRELPDEADRIGNPIKAGIEKASEFDHNMEDWWKKAKSFEQSQGSWSSVTSNLRGSSEKVYQHWRKHFDAMKKACARLVLGRDQPDVKRAVEEMKRDTQAAGDSYRRLRDEFNRWKDEVDKLREFSAKDVEEIRAEFCAAKGSTVANMRSTNEIADRWATQLTSLSARSSTSFSALTIGTRPRTFLTS